MNEAFTLGTEIGAWSVKIIQGSFINHTRE